ncbi:MULTISPECIES: type II toxin-antitoxin system TacA family antitoxin [Pasteurellaceae]|uniref:DUF1778 domain-containing protein n=1 Tax=Gallibacterium anatis 4895 TaxID=1396510 RepID=A0A0A2ZZF1_9PAST|nr:MULTISPECIES: DUF1778 domain-containing protein [Pasteurellaceae]AZI15139.1 DUF1778 domain-containing protein [Avibacterium paragallinarum]KGQ47431.1 hypothetical protein IO46_13235 [Gallibacterium anatis]KGQ62473.1 hypothetical protein IO48_04065 [Gallibacterium anatis 4895]MCW9716045.1 DUF1778 domain-containing protein [Avibacterium sp. 21-594]QIR12572.1 DUF1778 domain-containing protein [Avibacterium paragallinarum]
MPATARFEARINTDVQQLLKRAAILEGRSLSDFVISAALSAAKKTVEKNELIHLSIADQQCFAEALISPPMPNKKMQEALDLSTSLLGE